MPHLANECLEILNEEEKNIWPDINESFLIKDKFNIVVQINGKKRDLLEIEKEMNEEELIMLINKNDRINKFIENKKIIKKIYIKNKLINLIVN